MLNIIIQDDLALLSLRIRKEEGVTDIHTYAMSSLFKQSNKGN